MMTCDFCGCTVSENALSEAYESDLVLCEACEERRIGAVSQQGYYEDYFSVVEDW